MRLEPGARDNIVSVFEPTREQDSQAWNRAKLEYPEGRRKFVAVIVGQRLVFSARERNKIIIEFLSSEIFFDSILRKQRIRPER